MSSRPPQHDQALCIRRWDWSETSEVVWLFARRLGMVRALAKGSKRPKAPFSGGVELLTLGEMGVLLRESDLALLSEWTLTRPFAVLRRSLPAFNAAMYAADILARTARDHDPHPRLFDHTIEFLGALEHGEPLDAAILRWQWGALVETGFAPDLGAQEPASLATTHLFSPSLGRMLAEGDSVGWGGVWRIRAATLAALRSLAQADCLPATTDAETVDRANRLLASYLRYILADEPATMRLVFGGRLQH